VAERRVTAVGVVGLGVMGRPIALRLLAAGHALTVFDLDTAAVAAVTEAGAQAASSSSAVAAASDVVLASLPHAAAVEDAFLGREGLLAGARPGTLLIDLSTVDPALARLIAERCAAREVSFLDAPVSGGEIGAQEGSLAIMAGGEADDVERARAVLGAIGSRVVHVGPHGTGQIVKACNQIVVALTYAALGEALVLGSKSGVDPALILDVLSGGLAANRIMEVKRESLLAHDFRPAGPVDMTYKDLKIALAAADEARVPLPFTALVQQAYGSLRATGSGGLDHAALLTVFEAAAAHTIGAPG
jgi:2-hydroxy-3-oxopropionate reductase